jgi:hypothetical protein
MSQFIGIGLSNICKIGEIPVHFCDLEWHHLVIPNSCCAQEAQVISATVSALAFYYSLRQASSRKKSEPWAMAASKAAKRRVLSPGSVPRKER